MTSVTSTLVLLTEGRLEESHPIRLKRVAQLIRRGGAEPLRDQAWTTGSTVTALASHGSKWMFTFSLQEARIVVAVQCIENGGLPLDGFQVGTYLTPDEAVEAASKLAISRNL